MFKLWQTLSSNIIDASNKNILIPLTTFQMVEFTSKKVINSNQLGLLNVQSDDMQIV